MRTGVDIVEIRRIERIISKNREKFYNRIYSEREIEYLVHKKHNSKTIAGIFAAKEATSKLLGTGIGKIRWKDIEILHDENGRPYIDINKKIAKVLEKMGLDSIDISISHESDYAISFGIAFKEN